MENPFIFALGNFKYSTNSYGCGAAPKRDGKSCAKSTNRMRQSCWNQHTKISASVCSKQPILPQFGISLKRGYLQFLTSYWVCFFFHYSCCCCFPFWYGLFNCFSMHFLCRQRVHFAQFARQQRDKLSIASQWWVEKAETWSRIENGAHKLESIYSTDTALYNVIIYRKEVNGTVETAAPIYTYN